MAQEPPPVGLRGGPPPALRRPRRGGGLPAPLAGRRWPPPDGWAATWPTAYGGRGLGPAENFVVQEELARARAPELVGRIGVNLAGPTLLAHGTDDQKARWLPADPPRHRAVVPALLRARRRSPTSRPSARVPPGSTAGGCSNGAEGVDLLRPVRRLGRLPGPQRPRRPQAQGPVLLRGRHARRRRRGAAPRPAHRRGRVQRGRPARRVRPRRPAGRRAGRGMARGGLHAVARAGREPPPAGHPHAAPRGAAARGRRQRAPSTTTGCAGALAQAYVEVRLFQLHNWRSLSKLPARSRARAPRAAS